MSDFAIAVALPAEGTLCKQARSSGHVVHKVGGDVVGPAQRLYVIRGIPSIWRNRERAYFDSVAIGGMRLPASTDHKLVLLSLLLTTFFGGAYFQQVFMSGIDDVGQALITQS